ncbi:MAG: DUF481 domain-containing protein [Pirellulales bacterium]|nr:DUF481 domain-containing protein [Pirellulales bacterium]
MSRPVVVVLLLGMTCLGQPVGAEESYAPWSQSELAELSLRRLPPVEPIPSGEILGDVTQELDKIEKDESEKESRLSLEPAPWYRPHWAEEIKKSPWTGSAELGLDGSSGNSDTFNVRLGASAKRKTKKNTISFDFDYHKNTNDGLETANRLFFDWRFERPLNQKPWTSFIQGTTVYDEFQPWNVRFNVASGLGYTFIEDDFTTFQGRWGGGGSQEIGGPDQDWVPELNFGFDFEHSLSKRQKIKGSVEYFPDVTQFGEFRVINKASWEVLLDAEMDLSLKLTAADRYRRPNPGGKLNDVDYAIVLLWKY